MTDMFKINEYGEVIREGNVDNSVLYNETDEKHTEGFKYSVLFGCLTDGDAEVAKKYDRYSKG